MSTRGARPLIFATTLILLAACGSGTTPDAGSGPDKLARCGPNDLPETGLQGQVTVEDRRNGRSQQGYRCNLELVGQYQGEGSSLVSPSFGQCAYLSTSSFGVGRKQSPGVQVIDVSQPDAPRLSTTLNSPGMLIGTWESLKVNEQRQLLGGVAVGYVAGAGFFDVYDISQDCAQPVHLNGLAGTALQLPDNLLGHEGNWSPDGRTYWSASTLLGLLTAIDVEDPARPRILYTGIHGVPSNHGIEFSDDGNRAYLATGNPAGLIILDVSEVQSRKTLPSVREISSLTWNSSSVAQHALPVRYGDHPYLIMPDEFGAEGIRIFDIADETQPTVLSRIQLQIQLPENLQARAEETAGNGIFGYESHYCAADRRQDPTALACGFVQAGIRVFDIRDPATPREIAYFNPPAQTAAKNRLPASDHAAGTGALPTISDTNPEAIAVGAVNYLRYLMDPAAADLSTDWCTSPPRFVGDQLWVTCQDNGFMVLKFSNGVYPFR